MQACETKASDGEASDQQDASVPEIILLVENTRKGINLGPFLRCASAFGIQTIVVVGYDRCSVQGMCEHVEVSCKFCRKIFASQFDWLG
jgi:tRNA G18 (ribose-2'-O)-methylase SpoU